MQSFSLKNHESFEISLSDQIVQEPVLSLKFHTYSSTSFVIMLIHETIRRLSIFTRIHKITTEFFSKMDILFQNNSKVFVLLGGGRVSGQNLSNSKIFSLPQNIRPTANFFSIFVTFACCRNCIRLALLWNRPLL